MIRVEALVVLVGHDERIVRMERTDSNTTENGKPLRDCASERASSPPQVGFVSCHVCACCNISVLPLTPTESADIWFSVPASRTTVLTMRLTADCTQRLSKLSVTLDRLIRPLPSGLSS